MNILIIGQCTLHWGRMEFGNIGNFYILEPLVRELHKAFPNSYIKTTFQLSEEFCKKENIHVLPMNLYYDWDQNNLEISLLELSSADYYSKFGTLLYETPFIKEVLSSDLVIDFSGDIWGSNANFLGKDRFLVGLLKDRVAQLLNTKTVMIAGSPGPFEDNHASHFAKEVFRNFDLITNRESISREILNEKSFDTSNLKDLACPAFLFEPLRSDEKEKCLKKAGIFNSSKSIIGVVVCGWNFQEGPFDKWPRDDFEYDLFVEMINYILNKTDAIVCLLSHSNGFPIPPKPFKLQHGRDFPIVEQVYTLLKRGGVPEDRIILLNGVYSAWETKTIIGEFDALVSGRIHAAVAGLSQYVPTIILDYGHEPKAHKLKGFAKVANMFEFLVDPTNLNEFQDKFLKLWHSKTEIRKKLKIHIPSVKNLAKKNFSAISELFR